MQALNVDDIYFVYCNSFLCYSMLVWAASTEFLWHLFCITLQFSLLQWCGHWMSVAFILYKVAVYFIILSYVEMQALSINWIRCVHIMPMLFIHILILQNDVITCAHQVEQLENQLAVRMDQLKATVQTKTAVPTAQVYVSHLCCRSNRRSVMC